MIVKTKDGTQRVLMNILHAQKYHIAKKAIGNTTQALSVMNNLKLKIHG